MTDQYPTRRTPVGSLLSRLNYALLPGHCLLCKSDSRKPLDLCDVCDQDLPRIGRHCEVCSVPLPNLESDSEPDAEPNIISRPITCGECLSHPPAFSLTLAPYLYQAPVDHLIGRFKFKGDLVAGKVLGGLLARYIVKLSRKHDVIQPDIILPVPLHWRRQLYRGFNQANELAFTLGQRLDIPVNNKLVKRVIHTRSQLNLNPEQRQANLRNAFALRGTDSHQKVEGRSFAIVDDVITTGSTTNSMASLLMAKGARQIVVWAVARTVLEY